MDQEKNSDNNKFKEYITEGIEGNIVLIGFPHDLGARAAGKSFGQEYGPDCMRRFLPNIGPIHNPEFDIDISSIKLTDYGNIELIEDKTLENLQKKLINRSNKVLQNKSVPFVIGGSKDVNYGCLSALNTFNNNDQNRIGIISIQKFCDFSTYQKVELNSTNGILTFLTENPNIDINIMYFATEKYDNQIETNKFKHDYKNNLSFLHYEEIKKVSNEIKENMELPSTKGGTAFVEKLQEFSKRCDKIHLSVSLEALNSNDCPGVCNKSKQGLSSEEILEIAFQAGKSPFIFSIDFTDYCPSSEDYRTGILLCNVIYYFTMGYKRRLESK